MKTKFSDLNNTKKQKVYDLIAPTQGWTAQIVDPNYPINFIPNPETTNQWYERVKDEDRVTEYLLKRAAAKAELARLNDINSGV